MEQTITKKERGEEELLKFQPKYIRGGWKVGEGRFRWRQGFQCQWYSEYV